MPWMDLNKSLCPPLSLLENFHSNCLVLVLPLPVYSHKMGILVLFIIDACIIFRGDRGYLLYISSRFCCFTVTIFFEIKVLQRYLHHCISKLYLYLVSVTKIKIYLELFTRVHTATLYTGVGHVDTQRGIIYYISLQ
jgi:hypothetical protein